MLQLRFTYYLLVATRIAKLGIIKYDNIQLKVVNISPSSEKLNAEKQEISSSSLLMTAEGGHSQTPGDPVGFKYVEVARQILSIFELA